MTIHVEIERDWVKVCEQIVYRPENVVPGDFIAFFERLNSDPVDIEEFEIRITELEEEVSDLEKENTNLTEENHELREEVSGLENEVENLEIMVESLGGSLD